MSDATPPLVALVYARRADGSILLVQRTRSPFAGHWVAPGAELTAGEAPCQGAVRGLMREVGLTALDLCLKAVVRESSPRPDFRWLLFLYRCRAGGNPTAGPDIDDLRWWTPRELERARLPAAERWWLPHVLGAGPGVLEATLHYDAHRQLQRVEGDAPMLARSA